MENLAFKALTQILFSKVKGAALPKERCRTGFVFVHSQKLVLTIEYHPHNYIIEVLGHSWGPGAVFKKGLNKISNYLENLAFKSFNTNIAF